MARLIDQEFATWANALELSDSARQVVDRIRNSPPSRSPESHRSNVCGRYASLKMGCTISFESHTGELPFIILCDHDTNVTEFYDQPEGFKITYAVDGKNVGHITTPDFFVLTQKEAYWVEVKFKKELELLSVKAPARYVQQADGWHCPPAEAHAAQLGLGFKVVCPDDYPRTLVRNCQFLRDYYVAEAPVTTGVAATVVEAVQANIGITLGELHSSLQSVSIDAIFALIAKGAIFCDLGRHYLGDSATALVFPDPVIGQSFLIRADTAVELEPATDLDLTPGNKLQLYGNRIFDIVDLNRGLIHFRTPEGKLVDMEEQSIVDLWTTGQVKTIAHVTVGDIGTDPFDGASTRALEAANAIYRSLHDADVGKPQLSGSTLRRWKLRFRRAEKIHGTGYSGLIPLHSHKGNRQPRFPDWVVTLCHDIIKAHYLNPDALQPTTAYGQFCLACEEKAYRPPSMKWFTKQINTYSKEELEKKRRGPRAGYAASHFVYNLQRSTPPQGDHPWDIAHIDHTELDIELVDEHFGINLGKPWLTLFTSAYTRKVIGNTLSFDAPSCRSLMLVLRDCVKKHHRLPNFIVMDGGPEFGSTNFEVLLARNHCSKKVRPPHEARNGAVLERFFGTTNTEIVHNLKGNTKLMKSVRLATQSVLPANRAVWTLPAIHSYLGGFFDLFNETPHPALNTTPNHFHACELARLGSRSHRYIAYDDRFRRSTMVSTISGTAKVGIHGIRVNYADYWCPAFQSPAVQGTLVEVLYDPYDIRIAYALVNGVWEKCISARYNFLEPLSEKVREIASKELLKLRALTSSAKKVSQRELAIYIKSGKNQELELQRRKDLALAATLEEVLHDSLSSPALPTVPTTDKPVTEQEAKPESDDVIEACGSDTNE